MPSPFEGFSPAILWKQFEALTNIPRCSGNEKAAAAYVMAQAKAKGCAAEKDAAGNVVVRVPASPGKQTAPTVVLQGHLDMVGEKDSSSPHNFEKDAIPVSVKGEYLGANGTTLGADNGVGLAAAMALMDDREAVHGPLELLFTVDEETGLTGAQGLQAGLVKGKVLLNLDSEEEGAIYVGCAGGTDTLITLPIRRGKSSGQGYKVHVHGLKGGHSGLDINLGRGNAIKILARYLDRLRQKGDFQLVGFDGGNKHNAIPREAFATILLPAATKKIALAELEAYRADLKIMFGATDSGVTIDLEPAKTKAKPLTRGSRDTVLCLTLALPHGVLGMSQAIEGLVESSTNLAVIKFSAKEVLFHESSRSSVMPILFTIQSGVMAIGHLAGAKLLAKPAYPGWQPNMQSKVLARARAVHQRVTGQAPRVKAIHAGLECGIIGEKFGGMDMISFGPQIEWPHSPSEQVKIASVERFYSFLKALLADLAA